MAVIKDRQALARQANRLAHTSAHGPKSDKYKRARRLLRNGDKAQK